MLLYEKSLDIIIPSYRFADNAGYLTAIADLQYPAGWTVRCYVIGDHPTSVIPVSLQTYIDRGSIQFHRNERNSGINYTRNKGIDLSTAQWILILDDDIIPSSDLLFAYIKAIEAYPHATGFAGVVNFPEADSSFTKALQAAGYTYFFSLPAHKPALQWTTGANMLLNRSALGNLRFSAAFGTHEAGDEVELAIRLKENNTDTFISVPDAVVHHPWWNNGQPDFSRAARYSRGNIRLLQLHPQFTEYRFCNAVELLLLFFLLSPLLWLAGVSFSSLLVYALFIIVVDSTSFVLRSRNENGPLPLPVLFYTWLLKKTEQAAYALACIREGEWTGFFRRFDIELRERRHHFHINRWWWLNIAGLLSAAAALHFL